MDVDWILWYFVSQKYTGVMETGFPIRSGMTKRTPVNHRETLHPSAEGFRA